jgi:ligand-binding sensor domain-containing protein/serine phosphatase RsbU (regulator of sigma subunit)
MKMGKTLIYCIVVCLSIFPELKGQDYFFRQYSTEEGLSHPYVYSISQDLKGYLWIATGEGLYRFDGFEFELYSKDDGLGDNFITKIFRDRSGRLWFGHPNGSVSVTTGKGFSVVKDSLQFYGSVTDIVQDREGMIWVTFQGQGLGAIDESLALRSVPFSIDQEPLSQLEYLGKNKFLIGSENDIFLCRHERTRGEMIVLESVGEYPGSKVVEIISGQPGKYLITSQDEGIYCFYYDSVNVSYTLQTVDSNHDGTLDNLQGGLFDSKGKLWVISMGNGIIRYDGNSGKGFRILDMISTENGLVSDNIRSVFEDREGNLWFGLFGNGLMRYVDNNLSFLGPDRSAGSAGIYSLAGDAQELIFVHDDKIMRIDPAGGEEQEIGILPGEYSGDPVRAMYRGNDGRLWLGFDRSGLAVSNPETNSYESVYISGDDLANSVNFLTGEKGYIWVATRRGLCRIDQATGDRKWFTTRDGLPHNNINQVYIDSLDRVLVSTLCREIHYIDSEGVIGRLDNGGIGGFSEVVSIKGSPGNILWIATMGRGILKIIEDRMINYTRNSGLLSDYCYSLTLDDEGMPVISHRGGISSINPVTNRIKTFSQLEGIRSSVEFYPNSVSKDNFGNIWFGTSEGLLRYTSRLLPGDLMPPLLNIKSLTVDGQKMDPGIGLIKLKSGHYEIVVEYVGINFTNPENVLYQTKLEGYNKNWSELTPGRRVSYDRVGYGKYQFKLRSINKNDILSEIPSGFTVQIRKPFYLAFWFYLAIVVLIGLLFYAILKTREAQQKQYQLRLQKELDERTHEVVQQKEKIELINNDITASIRYAQTIQASILPPIGKLKDRFPGAFVYYEPKDIVSGDFYWYDDLKNDKYLIVSADSTGHGVPGAFMSMIGTTLIKDIISNMSIQSPSQLLDHLNTELVKALTQNIETQQSNDGMDLVVIEIDLRTYKVRHASAMSSMIIHRGQEQIYVRGNSTPIGGQFNINVKSFDDQYFELSKGDRIYMYSDGYQDQFGGPDGRKIKMSGVKKFLQDIQNQSMDEQYESLKTNFENWKEGVEQVDDVLFMGIEL